MRKFVAMLLVVLMTVACFAGCSSTNSGKSGLEGVYTQASALNEAEAFTTKASFVIGVTFDEPVFTVENMSALMGEEAASIMSVLSAYIKSDKKVEIPFSMTGITTADSEGQLEFAIGTGNTAIRCSAIIADEDIFLDFKSVYESVGKLLEPMMGGQKLPVWPYENAYVSYTDLLMLVYSMEEDASGSYDASVSPMMAFDDSVSGVGGASSILGGLGEMDMDTMIAFVESMMEAIPEESIVSLLNMLESALKEAGVLTTKDGYLTFTINGNNIDKIPDALVKAMEGKLATVIDDVLDGLRNSDNDIIASMIPSSAEANGQELEDALVDGLKESKEDMTEIAQEMKALETNIEMGIKVTKTSAKYKFDIHSKFAAEEEMSGKINLSAVMQLEATKDVTVRAPGNVLTEEELYNFFSAFGALMG